jgi:hypothetical protein
MYGNDSVNSNPHYIQYSLGEIFFFHILGYFSKEYYLDMSHQYRKVTSTIKIGEDIDVFGLLKID